jgi:5'-3' exoribonuclease 2
MGVPAFFRWLSRKYPSVIVHCIEQKAVDVNGVRVPTDSSEPNPNGVEFDNLYLDMNGIIHPCTHPEDRPAPRNEDEMMVAIFDCIDRIFNIVRPRKLLYMAIDGVAPRAKMNQQRSRRFRASKETVEKINEIKRIRAELLLRGADLPAEKPKEEHFDSNCITPGTPFMARLSDCLHYYIHERLNNDPGWQGIKVILSDANVPGEGEHKIMDYIRKQRAQPDHDPNTQHCLCGADADLIMLGLATHEPNFTIIREEFKPNKPRPCDICGQLGHEMKDCIGGAASAETDPQKICAETDFIFVRLNVLKEYLERELQMPNLPFKYEFERVLDDWVFMCFFVGNDFLPHLPSLEIREGAIDRLIRLYKDCVYKTGVNLVGHRC